jgi:D-alanine-D-alanine ligase-like ATP-grasp enzyme
MTKKKLVVIFGGRSSEHEVSCISVQTVAKAVDTDKYDMTLIGITKDGKWLKADSIESIADGSWYDSQVRAVISPDSAKEIIIKDGDRIYAEPVDVIFPVLHGLYGEDGTIQGLFEMADIPYVGCGVFASAAAMDKFRVERKRFYNELEQISGIRVIPSQANYFMIEITNGMTAKELMIKLFKNHYLLIKDLTSKVHDGKQYIRIAIRNDADNNKMLEALKKEFN